LTFPKRRCIIPRVDKTFSAKDVCRIFREHLTKKEKFLAVECVVFGPDFDLIGWLANLTKLGKFLNRSRGVLRLARRLPLLEATADELMEIIDSVLAVIVIIVDMFERR
jgi:hypothetical protein